MHLRAFRGHFKNTDSISIEPYDVQSCNISRVRTITKYADRSFLSKTCGIPLYSRLRIQRALLAWKTYILVPRKIKSNKIKENNISKLFLSETLSLTQPEGGEVPHEVHAGLGPPGHQPQRQVVPRREHRPWGALPTQRGAHWRGAPLPAVVELEVGASVAGVLGPLARPGVRAGAV